MRTDGGHGKSAPGDARRGASSPRAASVGRAPGERPASARRRLLRWLGGAALLAAAAIGVWRGGLLSAGRAENLLLITLDTTRADHLGCYGAGPEATPNLDRVARAGVRFARATTCSPITLPAHCTIMTGVYPFAHQVRRNGFERLGDEWTTLAELLKQAGYVTEAVVASAVLADRFGLAQGFDRYHNVPTQGGGNVAAAELPADRVCERALAALRALPRRGFFLWTHFYDPHHPYVSRRGAAPDSPAAYAEEIAFMDLQVGRLLAELRTLGLEKNTLLVIVGDHGEGLGEHGESEHGYFVYETTLRVPLLLRGPRPLRAGSVVAERVRTVDLTPTILDLLGRPAPAFTHGQSLRPLLAGRAGAPPPPAYGEAMAPQEVFALSPLRALVEGDWKYVAAPRPELYDLAADPGEVRNLAEAEPARADSLRGQLADLLQQTPPPAEAPEQVQLSPAEVARLRSLGYLAGPEAAGDRRGRPRGESLESGGGNPADFAPAIELYARAHRELAARRWAEAEPLLRQVVTSLPGAPNPWRDLATALRRQEKGDQLLAFSAELLAQHPDQTALRIQHARQLALAGRVDEAQSQLEEAVRRDAVSADARVELAAALSGRRRPDEARAEYLTALALSPQDLRALRGLASLYAQQERWEDAAALLEQAVALDPRFGPTRRELERVRQRLGR